MSSTAKTAITPTRAENFPEWYQQVIKAADLAENSDVRGCMIIKPWGWGIWENMQKQLDAMFKETGHVNAYFPLFIPLSFLEKEAEHVEGFAKECAVVTHHRLEEKDGKLVPAGELNEPLIVRPTSETIIGAAYARWVQSYRDLPLLINQTMEEAVAETDKMLGVYEKFAREHLALPVFTGEKSESERFPGAVSTLCIEAMVQDRKAIQAGTSHFLGQNFSRAAGIQFAARDGSQQFAWTTSWGVSTRLIGTLIMAHSDDDGLVLPPRVAPSQIVILPVLAKEESRAAVLEASEKLAAQLRAQTAFGEPVRVEIDRRDAGGGVKNWEWIKKGVPLRVEIGPRDIEKGSIAVSRRDRAPKEKEFPVQADFVSGVGKLLESMQAGLLERATKFRDEHTKKIDSADEFRAFFTPKNAAQSEIHGGFALAHWDGTRQTEEKIKEELKVTIRCVPRDGEAEPGICPFSGKPSSRRVVFAKSY